jgi:hypothetical protein
MTVNELRSHLQHLIDTYVPDQIVKAQAGDIEQSDFESIVQSGQMQGPVNILSGAHGTPEGEIKPAPQFFNQDVATFGNVPGVTVFDVTQMTSSQISDILNGGGTTIGAFCNSGACLAPFR